jgi:hypothetical protein
MAQREQQLRANVAEQDQFLREEMRQRTRGTTAARTAYKM